MKKPKVFSQPLVAGEQASPPYTPPGTIEARKGFGSTIRNSRLAALPLATLLPLSSAWSLRVFAPPCADACAVFRVFAPLSPSAARCSGAADALWACPRASSRFAAFDCALRFASCARHSSPSGLRIVRKLTRGAPCFTGLIGGYCTLNSQWSSCCALRLAVLPPLSSAWSPLCVRKAHLRCFLLHWAHRRLLQPLAAPPLSPSLGLLRPVSRTARGLRAPHWLRRLFRPHWTSASPVSATGGGEAPSLSRSPWGF